MSYTRSKTLFSTAKQCIPGGVNSPVRAFTAMGSTPLFLKKGQGAFVWDEDDNQYIDYVGSWGPLLLGHAHPQVIQQLQKVLNQGLSFGAPTEIETLLAQKILECMPSLQLVRMLTSGTEATMTALRLARAYTKRDYIVKFEGCYHGHSDSLLVQAGSGALTLGEPSSPGVPKATAALTLTVPYNDIEAIKTLFKTYGEQIAAVIVEPIAGNMGCIPPLPGFLETLRKECTAYGALLIADEVMTGFRVALGGAQSLYALKPDLTTLGKVIGGGLPVAALGGSFKIMSLLAPLGPVYQAGTLSGNPLAMHAGLSTLNCLTAPGVYEQLEAYSKALATRLKQAAARKGIPVVVHQVTGMWSLFFTEQATVHNLAHVKACDIDRFKRFFHGMLAEAIYLAPSAFEAGFISLAHDKEILEKTLEAAEKVFASLCIP